jgi:hypothetical protein
VSIGWDIICRDFCFEFDPDIVSDNEAIVAWLFNSVWKDEI